MASYTDAIVCPQCNTTGKVSRKLRLDSERGSLHVVTCMNKRCEWFETSWNVQVRPDGSVPDPSDHKGDKKQFIVSKSEAARMRTMLENFNG